jgi:hypothetical protein
MNGLMEERTMHGKRRQIMEDKKPAESGQPEEDYRFRRHYHRGISGISGGVFLILLGTLLYLATQGILAWDMWWQFLIIGIGVILLVDSLVRYQREKGLEFRLGRPVAGVILIGVGIVFLVGNVVWWPMVIILVGVFVIIGGLLRRGRNRAE